MSTRDPIRRDSKRWVPAAVITALICYWSLVASPPPIPLVDDIVSGGDIASMPSVTVHAAVVPIDVSWFDTRHGLAYAALARSLEYALADGETDTTRLLPLVFCVTICFGAVMEIGQLARFGRVASLADVASNAVGAGAAITLSAGRRRSFTPSSPSSDRT
ncbi:VanZ family protein [Natrinema halophilum]|uniref:VanZ family protein n=1 Tax=Natrinema halophilum TaxID=1699371 RepID=A0A7D5GSX3_9EURY|nr:VanZ family protein [Natrinema halophilum]QLG48926.1 VanZ family protein [Natrinema halophilum]